MALMVIAAVWAAALLMVVSLCRFARRGDEALAMAPAPSARRLSGSRRTRDELTCRTPLGAARR